MRRIAFLKALVALSAGSGVPGWAWAGDSLRIMIPANPGGGWDSTGRALGSALLQAGAFEKVTFENKGGAAGTLGLAQFVNASRGDPNALMVMGAVMLGGIITGKPPVSITAATPIARLTSEYNVFVLPTNSPYRTLADVVAQLKKNPASIKWGGGSRGATEHIAAAMMARAVGVDPSRINYVAFRGGGEAAAAVLGGYVTLGGSGYSEFAPYIEAGKMRAVGVTSDQRLPGLSSVPTLKELGIPVEIDNWRGVYGASGITGAQRAALTDKVVKATQSEAWAQALRKNRWTPALLSGAAFEKFVVDDLAALRATLLKSGLI
ncbi:MAG: C4-dicarboxylate ABC transporter substrate-binding protein [Betaproteobacteria bacterium HGW-Betaproteobacteria-18]|nr:MAG: C4-dicarboxylate ABC transporter substrate-binding protein [Betaproteobacteria bacterium HGW-Betaproteobacteria-18]